MNTPIDKNDGLNDDDMHKLLHSDSTDVPPALDKAILSAAHKAVTQSAQPEAVSKRWTTYWPQALSAAAVVVLAVVLVPYITSSPHSSLDSSFESSLASDENVMLAEEATTLASSSERATALAPAPAPQSSSIESETAADSTSVSESLSVNKSTSQLSTSTARSTARSTAKISSKSGASRLPQPESGGSAGIADDIVGFMDSQRALVARLDGLTFQSSGVNELGQADSDNDASGTPVERLIFMGNTFSWEHQNLLETGTFEFVSEDTFAAILPDRQLLIEFTQDAILWDAVRYELLK